jgi:HK97 family phage portal protein
MSKAYFQRFWNFLIWGDQRSTNLEDPNTSINGFTLTELFGGTESASGEKVNEKTAMTFSAVWRATAIISGIISSLPFKIYRKTKTGREEATDHPYWDLITNIPSKYYTKPVFFQRAINHYLNWGNFFARITAGMNANLELIHPSLIKDVNVNTRGNLVYTFGEDIGEVRQDKIIHIPNQGDGILGKGIINQAKDDIGLEFARRKYGSRYFKNGGTANSILTTDQVLKPPQREEIAEWLRKQKLAGSDLVIDSGFKYTAMSMPPEAAQFLQTGEFSVETIARWYGVPKSKLASSKDPTHTNIENMSIEFLQDTITPILSKIEYEYTNKLLTDEYYCEFDLNAYLRADAKTKAEMYRTGIMNGYMTINEVRAKENLNPIEGGDKPLVRKFR